MDDFSKQREFKEVVSNTVWRSAPPNTNEPEESSSTDPRFVIVFGWMDGSPKHVFVYANGYAQLFPSANIIVIRSVASKVFLRSSQRKLLSHVVEILRDAGMLSPSEAQNPSKLLIHSFSNGGSLYLETLFEMVKLLPEKRKLFPLVSVLDSCPGKFNLLHSAQAFAQPWVKSWLYWPMQVLFGVGLSLVKFLNFIALRKEVATRMRQALNSHQLGAISPRQGRLYYYSDNDRLIDFKAVEEHADDAKSKGLVVHQRNWKVSGHVQHLRVDKEQYWAGIEQLWRKMWNDIYTKKVD